ncbi:ferric iron uptake transcriptional regulator [Ectothiorhodospiraceae bacterium BW-2]|nr:ferric iron uptake transcriptional regulator [Ectothiorhodospiraceae bacterium BW-2]
MNTKKSKLGREEIKEAGLKVTLPRLKVLALLEHHSHRHLSAEELHQMLCNAGEEVGVTTVYRVLTQFEEAGLVCRHNFEGNQSVYELRQEDDHHDHIICIKCGRVDEFMDGEIEQRQQQIVDELGYAMTSHQLTIHGLCPKCQ